MLIEILCCAKRGASLCQQAEADYLKRLSRFCKPLISELPAAASSDSPQVIQRRDSARALSKISSSRFVVVLDETGKQFSSMEFVAFLRKRMASGAADTTFAVGGPYGWDDQIRDRAQLVLSLSNLTFPYLLARLVLLEQLYRGFATINGVPYHKE